MDSPPEGVTGAVPQRLLSAPSSHEGLNRPTWSYREYPHFIHTVSSLDLRRILRTPLGIVTDPPWACEHGAPLHTHAAHGSPVDQPITHDHVVPRQPATGEPHLPRVFL